MVKIFAYLDFLGNIHSSQVSAQIAEERHIENELGLVVDELCKILPSMRSNQKLALFEALKAQLPELSKIHNFVKMAELQDATDTE